MLAWTGLGVLVFGMLAALPFLVEHGYEASDETNDASIYVATARALLAGDGYSYLGEPFIVRPPGFAVMLAGVMRVFGDSAFVMNLFVSSWGVLACALLYVFGVKRIGAPLAFLCSAALFLHPEFRRMSNQVMSDVPGLALVLACLLVERWASSRRSWRRDLVLAVVIGASGYVRTLALLVIPATLLGRWFARAEGERLIGAFLRTRAVLLVAGVVVCVAPWSVRCMLRHPVPPVDQTFLYSYGTGMWHERPYDPESPVVSPARVLGRAAERVEPLVTSLPWVVNARPEASDDAADESTDWVAVAFGALLLASTAWLCVERRRAGEFFALLTVLLLLVYFAFRPRLVLPLQALLPVLFIEAGLAMTQRAWSRAGRGVAVVFSALIVARGVHGFAAGVRDGGSNTLRGASYTAAASVLRPRLGEERVASAIGWHWSVYLDRPVWSLALAARRGGASAVQAVLARHRIDTVVLADALPEDRALVPLLTRLWGEPDRVGDVSVFRRR
ncbi:MAG: glycosyltransferase family 39 protein [Planctomycetes bacterium]|nr:glycosyltransferase family 39 protein [Planctomycetota bacterium]